ncbi:cupin domain-containing protein [Phenylobacterium sp.]|uniref:cupin domain-containing protein n=1 Tax=Phenylobacterium sp. TaxID=1871053 RepID=UPI00301B90D9
MFRDVAALGAALTPLEVRPDGSGATSPDGMRVLGIFNQCMVGLVRFRGETPWERHPDDELLHVLDGAVEVTIEGDAGPATTTLRAGDLCVVPGGAWHRQRTCGVTLVYVTSSQGNEHRPAG